MVSPSGLATDATAATATGLDVKLDNDATGSPRMALTYGGHLVNTYFSVHSLLCQRANCHIEIYRTWYVLYIHLFFCGSLLVYGGFIICVGFVPHLYT